MREGEKKIVFLVSRGQLDRLPLALRRLAATVRSRPPREVHDLYLDTPTWLLLRSGVVCRLRRAGTRAARS